MDIDLSKEEILEYGRRCQKMVKKAYAPYSKFPVTAILVTELGEFEGVNIENRSFSLTVCAERTAAFQAVLAGAKEFKYIFVYGAESENPLPPCGACRQVLTEFSDKLVVVFFSKDLDYEVCQIGDLLPFDSLHGLNT